MQEQEINKKINELHNKFSTILSSVRTNLIVLNQLMKDIQSLLDQLCPEKDILKIILKLDDEGANLHKRFLMEKVRHIPNYEKLYHNLLLSGEIFEIEGYVYPTDTKNKVRQAEHDKES